MKQLRRSIRDRQIAGICAGIGDQYDIDPNIVRMAAVFVDLMTGIVPLLGAYLVGWRLIPEEGDDLST